MKKTLIAGVMAGACLTAGTIIAGGAPAMADSKDCPKGYVCVWGDMNYTGRYIAQIGTLDRPDIGSYMNDQTTSLWNRSGSTVCFYLDTNYNDDVYELDPGQAFPRLDPFFNDTISSWRRGRC